MATVSLNRHFYRYKAYPSTEWSELVQLTDQNTIDNGNGTFTLKERPNVNMATGNFQIVYFDGNGDMVVHSSNPSNIYLGYGLPRINLTVTDLITFDKQVATMEIVNGYNSSFSALNLYNGLVEIKLRGNSTAQLFPKKPYGIDLIDSEGEDNDWALLGMTKYKDWALLADGMMDATLVRNRFAYNFAKKVSANTDVWQPSTRSCEIYLNGSYIGVYSLTENVKRNKARVNINKDNGFLFEQVLDRQEDLEADTYFKTPITEVLMPDSIYPTDYHSQRIENPKFDDITPEQVTLGTNHVLTFESALFNVAFDNLVTGYRAYMDVPSAVNFYLINEILKNGDSPHMSLYYYKDVGQKIKFGPNWDYDTSFGMYVPNPNLLYMNTNFWFSKLLEDPYFLAQVKTRYSEIRQLALDTLEETFNVSEGLILSGAADRQFDRWENELVPEPYVASYRERVLVDREWMIDRIAFLDTVYLP